MRRTLVANKDFLTTVPSGTYVYDAEITVHKGLYGLGEIVLHCSDGTKLGVSINQYDLIRVAREALECSGLSREEEPSPWDDEDFTSPDGPIFDRRKGFDGGEEYELDDTEMEA